MGNHLFSANLTNEKTDRRREDKLSQHQQMLLQHQTRSGHQSLDKYSHSTRSSTTSSQAALESKPKHHYSDEHKITDFLR